jgi:D-alanyl-D-alanine dipeptidase
MQRIPTMPISDDGSSLISLLESGFDLVFEPSIMRDYRYLVRTAVHDKLGRISKKVSAMGKRLVIRSAWRSFDHQQLLWVRNLEVARKQNPEKSPDEIERIALEFTAPREESMHSTGGAVDALIYDPENDCVMDFGTNNGFKLDLNTRCYPLHPGISPEAKKNRKILMGLFEKRRLRVRYDRVLALRLWQRDVGIGKGQGPFNLWHRDGLSLNSGASHLPNCPESANGVCSDGRGERKLSPLVVRKPPSSCSRSRSAEAEKRCKAGCDLGDSRMSSCRGWQSQGAGSHDAR